MSTPDLDPHTIITHPASWGLIGSLIALRWAPGATWLQRASNVASAVSLTYVGAPALAEQLQLTAVQIAFAGLALGMFGLNVADAIIQGIRGTDLARAANALLARATGAAPPAPGAGDQGGKS